MKVFKTSQLLVKYLSKKTRPLGMVPTMGALHLGHLSLIKRALKENKTVLVSIFVNPTQFDNENDLENYPININQDLLELRKVSEKIIVYIPKVDDVFDCSKGHPILLKKHLTKEISLETMVIYDRIFGYQKNFDKKLTDPVWTSVSSRMKKYSSFLHIDVFKFKKQLKEIVVK